MDDKSTRMVFATAALAAVAAVLAGPAGARSQRATAYSRSSCRISATGTASTRRSSPARQRGRRRRPERVRQGLDVAIKTAIASQSHETGQVEPQTIPYLSQGIGVDQSQFAGGASEAAACMRPHAT